MATLPKGLMLRQRQFCDGIAAGLSGAGAARQAGYSVARAKATASRLRRRPDIQQAIERRRTGEVAHQVFVDPLAFLLHVMHDCEQTPRRRVAAAIALLPYTARKK